MATKTSIVQDKAFEFLESKADGIRYADLVRMIRDSLPDYPEGTVTGSIWNLDATRPERVYKASRGLFKSLKFKDEVIETIADTIEHTEITTEKGKRILESDFYDSFAEWLQKDLEECSRAIALGRNYFKDKWGTPDVIGILQPKKSDIVQFEPPRVCRSLFYLSPAPTARPSW